MCGPRSRNPQRKPLFDNGGKAGTAKRTIARPPPAPQPPSLLHIMQHLPLNPPYHCTKAHPLRSRIEEAPTLPLTGTRDGRAADGEYGRADRESPPPNSHTPTLSSPPHSDRRPGQGTSASSSFVTAAQQMERRKSEDGRRGNTVEQSVSSRFVHADTESDVTADGAEGGRRDQVTEPVAVPGPLPDSRHPSSTSLGWRLL